MLLAAWPLESLAGTESDGRHARYSGGRQIGYRVDYATGRSARDLGIVRTAHRQKLFLVKRVVDGDTLRLRDGNRVRLIGVDTPETKHPRKPIQYYGPEAYRFTKREMEKRLIRLETDRPLRDRYGRVLAYVYRQPDLFFLNAELVRQGYARAYTRYPFQRKAEFVRLERDARRNRRGLWAKADDTSGAEPAKRDAQEATAGRDCDIKGNIGRGGCKIYHVPGGGWYGRTKIDESKGERWFCSEEEARQAGWRKAGR